MILDITPDDVIFLEEYTHENYRDLIDSLNCCNADQYKHQNRFRFLPGHRSFVLRLPNEIAKMKTVLSAKRPNNSRNRNKNNEMHKPSTQNPVASNETGEMLVSENGLHEMDTHDGYVHETNENRATNDIESDRNEVMAQLQLALLNKLKNTGLKKNCQWANKIEMNSLRETEFTFDAKNNVLCGSSRVVCSSCFLPILVLYDRYWRTSNMLKHLDTHEKSTSTIDENDNETEQRVVEENVPFKNDLAFDINESAEDGALQRTLTLAIQSLESPVENAKTKTKTEIKTRAQTSSGPKARKPSSRAKKP